MFMNLPYLMELAVTLYLPIVVISPYLTQLNIILKKITLILPSNRTTHNRKLCVYLSQKNNKTILKLSNRTIF